MITDRQQHETPPAAAPINQEKEDTACTPPSHQQGAFGERGPPHLNPRTHHPPPFTQLARQTPGLAAKPFPYTPLRRAIRGEYHPPTACLERRRAFYTRIWPDPQTHRSSSIDPPHSGVYGGPVIWCGHA